MSAKGNPEGLPEETHLNWNLKNEWELVKQDRGQRKAFTVGRKQCMPRNWAGRG